MEMMIMKEIKINILNVKILILKQIEKLITNLPDCLIKVEKVYFNSKYKTYRNIYFNIKNKISKYEKILDEYLNPFKEFRKVDLSKREIYIRKYK